jgi:TolA-binding protein
VIRNYIIGLVTLGLWLASVAVASPSYSPHKYQQNDWFGEFGENASMYVNPAGIVEADQLEASLGIFRTIAGEAGQQYATVVIPYDYDHSFGMSFFMNGATVDGGQSYVENSYMFGYAYRVMHALALGVDLAVLQINQFDQNKQLTFGLDLGISWNPIANSKLGHLQVGAALQNALAPAISTARDTEGSLQIVHMGSEDVYKVPTNLNLSLFWRGLNRKMEAKAELSVIDLTADEATEGTAGKTMEQSFTFTYYLSYFLGVRARLTKEGYPVLGATVNAKDVNVFRYLELDLEMSHDDIIEAKNRGFLWNVKLTSRFGPTREESIGLRRYKRLKIEPENDYRRAMRYYLNREFLKAAYAFGKVITKYPAFHLVDQAAFYKGKSFENMRMHQAATKTYEEAIKKYPHSDQRAKYQFQLMNIDYKEGKFAEAMIKYQIISKKYADTDVKADADYIAGQIKFEENAYQECIDLMSPILPGNANYFYARYTMGIAYSRLGQALYNQIEEDHRELRKMQFREWPEQFKQLVNEKWGEAEASFSDVIDQVTSNRSEEDIQDAARVKLGHIFFSDPEAPNLPEAARLYGTIKPSSHVYDEAQLALAWSFLKVAKPDKALPHVRWIIENKPDSYLLAEAHLVEGYCHYMKKDWKKADKALAKAENLTKQPLVSSAARDSARAAYEGMKDEFEKVQMQALDLARQLPTPRVQQRRNKLQPDFDKAQRGIENYAQFLNRALQSDRFEKNRERILEDAQFTRADISTKGSGGGGLDDGGLGDELELQ